MEDCVFCKIVNGENKQSLTSLKQSLPLRGKKESDNFIIISDINPSAKVHLLLVSKKHIQDFTKADDNLIIEAKKICEELQRELNLDEFQFRVNWGKLLEVNHLHYHFLAGFNN